jgi:hypothetical protein
MITRAIPLGLAVLSVAAIGTATTWRATLEAKDGSKIGGTALVESMGYTSSRASVELSGAKPGSLLPWHVHTGACGAKGNVLGDPAVYAPLSVGPDGRASGNATLAIVPPATGELSVNVHKSKTDMTPIACGTLKPEAAAPKDTASRP